jgi:hypothetical protein
MTSLMPDLDASQALLAELHGDPRFTEPDVPAPRYIAHLRDVTETIIRRAALDATTDPS